MNELQIFNADLVSQAAHVPDFRAGDTLSVTVKLKDRSQDFSGVCIRVRNRSIGSTFMVRKVDRTGVLSIYRTFFTYSPMITVKVLKRGKIRRAKLYYLMSRYGKSARILPDRRRAI